ncbi:prolyl oligopeptidase family serine peptidase [Fulvivirga ligni]|uniref:carboxylesterase family protein n=1 Tax=Fulvivirga ligni TaxID=2904246 RepID=UPI001F4381A9|nr:prolyl oligopeptidase family serine peptidase [Fulvivirga ligni]UII21986.1 prolyl oligopeptidase family serine peptidase [Fulvivirga ligni]
MSKILSLIFLLGLGFNVLAQESFDQYLAKTYHSEDDSLNYRILYPENFDENKEYPLVLFLHGAGERGDHNQKQLFHGGQLFIDYQDEFPAIVVFPQCPTGGYWSNVNIKSENGKRTFHFDDEGNEPPTKSLSLVMELLDSMVSLKFTNQQRVYVAGLSMGGMGTFELVSRKPDTFAAAIAICGGDNPVSAKSYAGKVPFWIFHGRKDDIVPPENSEIMAEAIEQAGGEVKLTIYPEANHNSWDSAFAEPEFLPWLFSKQRN